MRLLAQDVRGLDGDPHLAACVAADNEALVSLTRCACRLHHEHEAAVLHRDFGYRPWPLIRRRLPFAPTHVHHLAMLSGNNNASRFWYRNCGEFRRNFQG
jgi:hypothetical protein